MNHPAPEDPQAALREEIRRAGHEADRRWPAISRLALLAFAVPLLPLVWFVMLWPDGHPALAASSGISPFGFVAVVLLGNAAHQKQVRLRRAAFEQRVRELAAQEAYELLLPLSRCRFGEARDTAVLLLRSLGHEIPTELTPACTPEGSGAEVSGVTGSGERG